MNCFIRRTTSKLTQIIHSPLQPFCEDAVLRLNAFGSHPQQSVKGHRSNRSGASSRRYVPRHEHTRTFNDSPLALFLSRKTDQRPRSQSSFAVLLVISFSTPWFILAAGVIIVLYWVIGAAYLAISRQLKRIESVSRSPIYVCFAEVVSVPLRPFLVVRNLTRPIFGLTAQRDGYRSGLWRLC